MSAQVKIWISLILLMIILILMGITLQALLHSYYLKKHQSETIKIKLQSQLDFLNHQVINSQDKLKFDAIKNYDQAYGANLQEELKNAYKFSSAINIAPEGFGLSLQALKDDKRQQINNIESKSFFSYIPEWPLLILGVLGIIATKIINCIVDFAKEWICNYFSKRKKLKENIETDREA